MKRLVFLIISLFLFCHLSAQVSPDGISTLHYKQLKLQQNGMLVLGSWAAGNFAYSGFGLTRSEGVNHYFHQMNVMWNAVNMGIAITGYIGATKIPEVTNYMEPIDKTQRFSKALLINSGLDAAYIMTGMYLRERSDNVSQHQARLKGYGNSLLVQGSYLLLFDMALLFLNEQILTDMMEVRNNTISLSPTGVKWVYRF